ncbi:low molecular weight protein-tyrosine-phosphatase [Aneurinibacillus terranovensis]|uniref:low molecular weight protein-tyrosine-phosphatase n=1 Tax=Aneurinibacillus terranovensis TaxID=278991 RepID=UPI00040A4251|nr:low molecular weight protein-tyrosine-phosphatase [Aneurinibacillus terranovensis]
MPFNDKISIVFVCLGNVCRSPLGEGVFRHLAAEKGLIDKFVKDSAGTGGYHIGEPPHPGSRSVAGKFGVSLDGQLARQFTKGDLPKWDYIIAMDSSNHRNIIKLGNPTGNVHLLREFDPKGCGDVPDPWGRGDDAFLETYTIIYRCCEKLLDHIVRVHHLM